MKPACHLVAEVVHSVPISPASDSKDNIYVQGITLILVDTVET